MAASHAPQKESAYAMAVDDVDMPDDEGALRAIVWSETFQMGDAVIDAEHRQFIDIVNRLSAVILDRADPATISAVCDELMRDAAEHFAAEEASMERHGFGGLPAHRREHARLLVFIRETAARVRAARRRPLLIEGALAIKDALLTHMFRVDVHYKSHFLDAKGR